MGRKSVREDKLYEQGGLLSFPRTGCALLRCEDVSTACRDISRCVLYFLGVERVLGRSLRGLAAAAVRTIGQISYSRCFLWEGSRVSEIV